MTAVAATRVNGSPVLVGDVVLSIDGKRCDLWSPKIYEIAKNLIVGWSGSAEVAKDVIRNLRVHFHGREAAIEQLDPVLAKLRYWLHDKGRLELIGWMLTANGPKVFRWATHYDPVRLSDADASAGSGGEDLIKSLRPAQVRGGNQDGDSRAPLEAISGFAELRFQEMLRRDGWPQTWGKAYDMMVLQGDEFRWMPTLTYVGWDVYFDEHDRITRVEQAQVIFQQERVVEAGRPTRFTVLHEKDRTSSVYESLVSWPIDLDTDVDRQRDLKNRPFNAAAPYYAHYLRLNARNFWVNASYAFSNTTREGGIYFNEGSADSSFTINVAKLEPELRGLLARQRALIPGPKGTG